MAEEKKAQPTKIIGIGASAGGLNALQHFFSKGNLGATIRLEKPSDPSACLANFDLCFDNRSKPTKDE